MPLLVNPPICIIYYVLWIVIGDTENPKKKDLVPLVQQKHSEKLELGEHKCQLMLGKVWFRFVRKSNRQLNEVINENKKQKTILRN